MRCRVFIAIFGLAGSLSAKIARENTLSSKEALKEASHAVVLILSSVVDYHLLNYSETANGILISEDGYILTVSHGLIGGNPKVYVGNEHYPGKIVYNNCRYDFAILKIDVNHPLPYIKFAGDNSLRQEVYLIGKRKRSRELFMSKGILNVKGINMSSKEISWVKTHIGRKKKVEYAVSNGILHSAHFFVGLSGCPLLNGKGEVIGMNTGIIGHKDKRITLALELICFLPVIKKIVNAQPVTDEFYPCNIHVDLEDPLKRVAWVMNGLFHYTILLGKDTAHLEKLRKKIEAQACARIIERKMSVKETIRWAWETYLNESYKMK